LLDFPSWFARQRSSSFAGLADRIWDGVFAEEAQRSPPSESELGRLAAALDDLPDRLNRTCVWEPYPALHARYVECVSEIRTELTRQTAEEWAAASAGFAGRLCVRPLSLAEGVSVVGDWLRLARRLRHAMGAVRVPTSASTAPITRDVGAAAQPATGSAKGRATPAKPQTTGTGDAAVCGWREAMEATGLRKTKLYELFRDGALKGYRDGRMIRFYRKGLADYMRERENVRLPPPRPARRPRAKSTALPATRFQFL
jgi:excisionase family DNA binding protein